MRCWKDADADLLQECRDIDCKIARIWITDSSNLIVRITETVKNETFPSYTNHLFYQAHSLIYRSFNNLFIFPFSQSLMWHTIERAEVANPLKPSIFFFFLSQLIENLLMLMLEISSLVPDRGLAKWERGNACLQPQILIKELDRRGAEGLEEKKYIYI